MSARMGNPTLLYFGPLKESGHFMFYENEEQVSHRLADTITPWKSNDIDGTLQPGMILWRDHWISESQHGGRSYHEGEAVIHHKDGWTALSFWDSTIDTRPGCSSTYLADGSFTFEQMVELAKARFAERWNKMKFEVRLAQK